MDHYQDAKQTIDARPARERIMAKAAQIDRLFGDDIEAKSLIVAAAWTEECRKDLLAALKTAENRIAAWQAHMSRDEQEQCGSAEELRVIRAAIAKAEGK